MKKSPLKKSHATSVTPISVLVVAAFLAPGAWLVAGLPPVEWSQFLQAGTAAAWLIAAGLGLVALLRMDRFVAITAGVLVVVAIVSAVVAGDFVQALFYDIYGDMPLIQWFALSILFLVGASLAIDGGVVRGLQGVVIAGSLLAAFMIVWDLLPDRGFSIVFGSSAYSVPAMAPLIPVALALGVADARRIGLWRGLAALIGFAVAVSSGSLMGTIAVVFALVAVVAFEPALLGVPEKLRHRARRVAVAGVVLAVAGMLFFSIPALSGSILGEDRADSYGASIASRVYLWNGAQRMFAEQPLLGFGPSGYRLNAVEYLDAGVFPSIARLGGDPIAYSPPSPHSLLWDVLTRLGIVGLAAFLALVGSGASSFVRASRSEQGQRALMRRAIAAGASVYLFALMTTPIHFASGLLGALLCGLAVSPVVVRPTDKRKSTPPTDADRRWYLVGAGVALLAVASWLAIGNSTASIDDAQDLQTVRSRVESAASIIPGHPMNERRRLEVAFLMASDEPSRAAARAAIDAAPDYIHDYLPNLAMFAQIGLNAADESGRTDVSWEAEKLGLAATGVGHTPVVIAENLHLALVEGDIDAIRQAYEPAAAIRESFPAVEDYVVRADALIAASAAE